MSLRIISFLGCWEIKNIAQLLEWASPRICATREEFYAGRDGQFNDQIFDVVKDIEEFQKLSRDTQNELIVLDCFQHDVNNSNGQNNTSSIGLVVSS